MKKIFTVLLSALCLSSFAQNDSVTLGAGATNMVFYSLSNGLQGTAPNNDWHIAFAARQIGGFTFATTNQATAIRINEAYGLKLFRSPSQKLDQYASFDTTGWRSWQQMHNPDTTWTVGAFNVNINLSDPFNFGWGEYNQGDHNIYSDSSMYLLQMPDGSFIKFAILNLLYDTAFNVAYSALSSATPTLVEIRKAPYSTKNFVYLDLTTSTLLDKEPAITAWDMMVLRYTNTAYDPSNPNQDIGVLSNDADSERASSGPEAQAACYQGDSYSNYINTIGKTWKTFNGIVSAGLADFVKTPTGSYRIVFNDLDTVTGTVGFTINVCSSVAGIASIAPDMAVTIYPVPASGQLTISMATEQEGPATIVLTDMTGRAILSQSGELHSGTNDFVMNTAALQAGNYVVTLSSAAGRINKLVSVVR